MGEGEGAEQRDYSLCVTEYNIHVGLINHMPVHVSGVCVPISVLGIVMGRESYCS